MKASIGLGDVAETLLITLYFRAVEGQRPDTLVQDARLAKTIGSCGIGWGCRRLQ